MTPFGEYLPDLKGGLDTVVGGKNVVPTSSGKYGPVQGFSATVATLPARVIGAIYAMDKDYVVSAYCGTAAALYQLAGGGSSWTDRSKSGGYTTGTGEQWEFAQFGNRLVATNFTNAVQTVELTTGGNFADLSASAPRGRHIAAVNRFVMLGNTTDATYGARINRLWWSAIDDATNWPTPATSAAAAVQSGFVDIFGTGGGIQWIAPRVGALDAIIVQERALVRCQYVGLPDVFSLQPLEGSRGSPAPGSVSVIGGMMYYLGEDGFYACDGAQSIPIGAGKVDDTFWSDVNQSFLNRICAVYDAESQCWLVGYPSQASPDGTIDRILPFNVMTRRWGPAWQVSLAHLNRIASVGYTLENLDAFFPSGSGGIDGATQTSFDSRAFAGANKPLMCAFAVTTGSTHALGYFSGATLEAELETGDTDAEDNRLMTTGIRPYLDGVGLATVTCKVGFRDTKNANVQYTPAVPLNRALLAPVRRNARFTRAVVTVASGSTWQQLQGFDFNQTAAGSM